MNTPQLTWLDELDPVRLPENEKVRKQWVSTYAKIHRVDEDTASSICDRETVYWKKAVMADEKLKSCNKLSLYSAFLELSVNGLSLQPGSKSECYLQARSVKGGKDQNGNDAYINLCYVMITAYGELNLRIRSGQIIRMHNPVVLYQGDHFQPCTDARGMLVIDYKPAIPRKSNNIFGCYVAIVLPGGDLDFKWLLTDDIARLAKFSTPKYANAKANALYSSENGGIDPGFLEAKTIKHAMRAYTKLRVGENVAMDDEPDNEDPDTEQAAPFGNPLPENNDTQKFEINPDEPF